MTSYFLNTEELRNILIFCGIQYNQNPLSLKSLLSYVFNNQPDITCEPKNLKETISLLENKIDISKCINLLFFSSPLANNTSVHQNREKTLLSFITKKPDFILHFHKFLIDNKKQFEFILPQEDQTLLHIYIKCLSKNNPFIKDIPLEEILSIIPLSNCTNLIKIKTYFKLTKYKNYINNINDIIDKDIGPNFLKEYDVRHFLSTQKKLPHSLQERLKNTPYSFCDYEHILKFGLNTEVIHSDFGYDSEKTVQFLIDCLNDFIITKIKQLPTKEPLDISILNPKRNLILFKFKDSSFYPILENNLNHITKNLEQYFSYFKNIHFITSDISSIKQIEKQIFDFLKSQFNYSQLDSNLPKVTTKNLLNKI